MNRDSEIPELLTAGAIVFNTRQNAFGINDEPLQLTTKEHEILEYLFLHKGVTATKEMLLNHLYPSPDSRPETKTIEVFVCYIRGKIDDLTQDKGYGAKVIRTVWGRGYVLQDAGMPNANPAQEVTGSRRTSTARGAARPSSSISGPSLSPGSRNRGPRRGNG